jgi:cellulose synthase/poly-beta-1,6-N-acetylglucosamine synthase-like glycosyltransferase
MPFLADIFENPEYLLFSILVIFALIQLFYHWYYFARIYWKKNASNNSLSDLPVSVIICAKNEYANLKENLPLILEQDYPDFEVILVNDHSQDDSYFLLKSYEEKYKNFRVVHLRENVNFFEGKKLALAVGIKSAKNEQLLLTDADCKPNSSHWIREMAKRFSDHTEIVLGYGGYFPKPGFLNKLIRFDTITIAMQYLGLALAGKPYMGVGRNLSYKKSLFFKSGGFTSHYKIKSGDDDLFINQVAIKKNTEVALHPDSFTFSEAKKSFGKWFKQKKRHMSTGRYYKPVHKYRLGMLSLSGTLFYLLTVILLLISKQSLTLILVGTVFFTRTLSIFLLYYYCGKKFNEPKLFLYSPIFDIIMLILNPLFALSNLFYKKNKWK